MGRNSYKIYENQFPHFVSGTIINWIPLFSNTYVASIIFNSLKYLQNEDRLIIYAYVLMENHYHLIVSSPSDLRKEMNRFRSFTARKIIDFLKEKKSYELLNQLKFFKLQLKRDRSYQLWQEGTCPKLINSEEMMLQKLEYIHNNPVKRGYVVNPVHWRYSSAFNYSGKQSPLNVTLITL